MKHDDDRPSAMAFPPDAPPEPTVPPDFRCGAVAVVGRANVGKSTLVNRLVGHKIAIVSPVAQTTRHRILGVRHLPERGQIAFVDTPGLHKPHHQLGAVMNEQAAQAAAEVDLLLVVVDASEGIGPGDRYVLGELKRVMERIPAFLVFNKLDAMNKGKVLPQIEAALAAWPIAEAIPVSAQTGDNCDHLLDVVLARLPQGPPLYPVDFISDLDERLMIAEIVREKLLHRLRQEVPHAVAVAVERIEQEESGPMVIDVTIYVEKPGQKAIVIGAGGAMLKEVGSAARKEIESRVGQHAFLRLWVKVKPDWRDRTNLLRELGVVR